MFSESSILIKSMEILKKVSAWMGISAIFAALRRYERGKIIQLFYLGTIVKILHMARYFILMLSARW